jgi:hypothetical protein
MKHHLVSVYKVYSNKCHGVKNDPTPDGHCFSLYVYSKNFKKYSFKNPKELELKYLA